MLIQLLNQNNIVGKGLCLLLQSEGHNVKFVAQKNISACLSADLSTSLFFINIEFITELSCSQIERLKEQIKQKQGVLLYGKLHQMHWMSKFSALHKGFICKKSTLEDLLQLLEEMLKKEEILDRYATSFLKKNTIDKQKLLLQKSINKAFSITELLLMREVALGKSTKKIAKEQHLSVHTIYNHRKNIKHKFECSDELALSKFCMIHRDANQTLIFLTKLAKSGHLH